MCEINEELLHEDPGLFIQQITQNPSFSLFLYIGSRTLLKTLSSADTHNQSALNCSHRHCRALRRPLPVVQLLIRAPGIARMGNLCFKTLNCIANVKKY